MFIQTEDTPNPETLKFNPGIVILKTGTADFSSIKDASQSPLALRLFEVDGVSEQIAREALYKASAKLPIKTKFVKR